MKMLMKGLHAEFTVEVFKPMWVRGNIVSLKVDAMEVKSTSFGRVNEIMFTEAFNTMMEPLALMLPMLNEIVYGVPVLVPSLIIGMF